MQTVPVTINPTKETKEVIDCVDQLIVGIRKAVKSGEGINAVTKLAMDLLKPIYDAIEGADQLDDEAKSKNLDDNLAYLQKVLGESLIPSAKGNIGDTTP